jgi:hypothetical protein
MTIQTDHPVAFLQSLPYGHKKAAFILSLDIIQPQYLKKALGDLAKSGYLGCLPFAKDEIDTLVVRLLPRQPLSNSPVAIASGDLVEGLTIAPDLAHFVAGRMAQREVVTYKAEALQRDAEALLQFSAHFGPTTSVENVLSHLSEIERTDPALRSGKTWAVADRDNPLFDILAAAWTLKKAPLGEWAINAVQRYPDHDIPWRLFVTHHILTRSGADLTEAVARLVRANDIFDPTYISRYRKPGKGAWAVEALVLGVRWAGNQPKKEMPLPESLWQAARAYAEDPNEYDGLLHFEVAREIRETHPELAFKQMANAAGFYARRHGAIPPEIIIEAHDICTANHWPALTDCLALTREALAI